MRLFRHVLLPSVHIAPMVRDWSIQNVKHFISRRLICFSWLSCATISYISLDSWGSRRKKKRRKNTEEEEDEGRTKKKEEENPLYFEREGEEIQKKEQQQKRHPLHFIITLLLLLYLHDEVYQFGIRKLLNYLLYYSTPGSTSTALIRVYSWDSLLELLLGEVTKMRCCS